MFVLITLFEKILPTDDIRYFSHIDFFRFLLSIFFQSKKVFLTFQESFRCCLRNWYISKWNNELTFLFEIPVVSTSWNAMENTVCIERSFYAVLLLMRNLIKRRRHAITLWSKFSECCFCLFFLMISVQRFFEYKIKYLWYLSTY